MSKVAEPYLIKKRDDSNTFRITLNPACGLPHRVCAEWKRRSFQDFPDELSHYRNAKYTPKKNGDVPAEAKTAVLALIAYLKEKQEEGNAWRIRTEDITVGAWIEKFTAIATNPRTGIVASANVSYSPGTIDTYRSYYDLHIKGDPFTLLKMAETEEEDVLEFFSRLSLKKLSNKCSIVGTRTFVGIKSFVKMTFREYKRRNGKWLNPFDCVPTSKKYNKKIRDVLPEEEIVKLFEPGVLKTTMELAVCAVMFLSGLRRSEIFALKPEDLDWHTPKITVRKAWQNFDRNSRVLGPPKGKKERKVPFYPILQKAIKKLWVENGEHEFVFSLGASKTKDGKIIPARIPGSDWIYRHFPKWLKRAGIELNGREIVPHSSRHSLASLLETKGVPLRYIQELLGHSDLETTLGYLHSPEKTVRDIGDKISAVMNQTEKKTGENKLVNFKVS